MTDHSTMTTSVSPISDLEVDLLVLPTWIDDDLSDVPGLIEACGGALENARTRGEWSGKPYTSCIAALTTSEWRASRLLLIGAGDGVTSTGQVRRLATTATLAGRSRRVSSLAFYLRGQLDCREAGQAAAEGLTLGEFDSGTSTSRFVPLAKECARSAKTVGVKELPGSFAKALASLLHSPKRRPRLTALINPASTPGHLLTIKS